MQINLNKLQTRQAAPTPMSTLKSTGFDNNKYIKLVPLFQEDGVDKYFVHFAKQILAWNGNEKFDYIVANTLVEKVQEIPSVLLEDISAKCDELRKAILKTYQLVREAY